MLQIKNLCASYDGTERLHDLCAEIRPGRLTAVIGPNGCGKSTLIRCIAGVMQPSGGAILLEGRSLCEIPPKERARQIAYMPQSRIVPDISVRQLAAHGRYPHLKWGQNATAADRKIVEDALCRTELLPLADRLVSRLSGGERQRVYLAMMLVQQSPLMLLDEPGTYLDLAAQFSLMELLRDLCREGRSVAAVLHDLSLALEYADDVLLMQNGRLIASGTPGEIYASGALQAVFGVMVARTENGKYIFSRASQEECP